MDDASRLPDRIAALAARLDLDKLSWADIPVNDDRELAIEELDSRSLRLRGVVFEAFIRGWFEEFPPEDPISNEEMDAYLDQTFDEKTVSMTRFLRRQHIQEKTPVSLKQVASQVYDPAKPSFNKSKADMIKRIEDAVRFLGIWDVEHTYGQVNGREEIRGYKISLGPVAIAFYEHVFNPLRDAQIRAFTVKHHEGGAA